MYIFLSPPPATALTGAPVLADPVAKAPGSERAPGSRRPLSGKNATLQIQWAWASNRPHSPTTPGLSCSSMKAWAVRATESLGLRTSIAPTLFCACLNELDSRSFSKLLCRRLNSSLKLRVGKGVFGAAWPGLERPYIGGGRPEGRPPKARH